MAHRARRALVPLAAAVAAVSSGFVAVATPAAAAPTLGTSFNAGLGQLAGIAFDNVTGNTFVYPTGSPTIHEFSPAGTQVDTIPSGICASDEVDLDFAPEPVNIGGTVAPANRLFVLNGDECNDGYFVALNKSTGAVVAGPTDVPGQDHVGGSWSAPRNSLFALDWRFALIEESDTATSPGTELSSFSVVPTGSPAFGVSYGDVDVSTTTGNLYVVGSSQQVIRELTPTGTFVRDVNVGALGVTEGLSGIALNDQTGAAWLSGTGGTVYRIDGLLPAQPTLSVSNRTVAEGNSGTRNASFTFTLSGPSASPITVRVATANGTATAPSDYTGGAVTLTFQPGQTSRSGAVKVKGDTTVEPNETFFVNLSNPTGATIADGQGLGTITNDD